MPNRILVGDAALPEPIGGALAAIEDPVALEILYGILQLDAAGLRALAVSSERMAEDAAPGPDRDNFVQIAEIARRMAASKDAMEQGHE